MNHKKNNSKGMGLIEIIISITVLSIGILGLLQAFPQGNATARSLELEAVANHLAQEKIEEIISSSYDEIAVGAIESNVRVDSDQTSPLYLFKRTATAELVDQNLIAAQEDIGLKKVTVVISWIRPLSMTDDSVSITTLISER